MNPAKAQSLVPELVKAQSLVPELVKVFSNSKLLLCSTSECELVKVFSNSELLLCSNSECEIVKVLCAHSLLLQVLKAYAPVPGPALVLAVEAQSLVLLRVPVFGARSPVLEVEMLLVPVRSSSDSECF